MDWANQYKSHVVEAKEAVQAVKSGNRIFMTGNVSVPQKLLAALVDYAPDLKDVEICQALSVGPADYVGPTMEDTFGSTRCLSARMCAKPCRRVTQISRRFCSRNSRCYSRTRSFQWM